MPEWKKFLEIDNEEDAQLVVECLAIYMGDYEPERQYAASILLKLLLRKERYRLLMDLVKEEMGFKVNNRSDAAVVRWVRNVKKIGRCEVCGSTEKLVAHHIIPWEYSVKGRIDISNGQCLCSDCHKMMHDRVGWVNHIKRCSYG